MKSVAVNSDNFKTCGRSITFYEAGQEILGEFVAKKSNYWQRMQIIEDNVELIGMYGGVQKGAFHITSFGLIVKVV